VNQLSPISAPRRGHFLCWAIGFTLFALYGSLVPLRPQPLSFQEAVERYRAVVTSPLTFEDRSDWVSNILLFMPIGFLWMAAICASGRRGFRALLVAVPLVLVCAMLSASIEFMQLWIPPRVCSQNDIAAETIGAAIGAGLWLLLGSTLADWLRRYFSASRPKQQFDSLLQAYFVGFAIYAVMPLDVTISPNELAGKYRAGGVVLVPFRGLAWNVTTVYSLFTGVILSIPIGMFLATAFTLPARPVRPWVRSALMGICVAGAIEMARVFVASRDSSTTGLLVGALGSAIGAGMMSLWSGGRARSAAARDRWGFRRRARPWLIAACVYSVFVILASIVPFEVLDDPARIPKRFHGFFRIPLETLFWRSPFQALTAVLRDILLFAPLGALLAGGLARLKFWPKNRRILQGAALAACAALAIGISMLQIYFPPNVPDCTDVLVGTAGAWLGMRLALRMFAPRKMLPERPAAEVVVAAPAALTRR